MLVLLTVLFACDRRCPTFDELKVRLSDDGESPTIAERAELAISNFRSWTTLDGVCVDDLRVGFNQTEWEHPAWLNDGRDQLRISPYTRADQVYGATLHGLCHAADEALGGLSETRPDLFEHPIPGALLTRRERMRENFADACARGPGGDNGADVDDTCDPTLAYAQKRLLLETVFDAVEDVDTFPLLPFVLGEEVPLALPEGVEGFSVAPAAHGLVFVVLVDNRWVSQTFDPLTGALVQAVALEEAKEGALWWELVPTTGERALLVRSHWGAGPEDQEMSAWELGHDGSLARLGASSHIAASATTGVAEPRGVWDGSGDTKLFDLNTNVVLGTASSLLGVRGQVFGVAGEDLLLRAEDGATLVVSQDGVVQLAVPRLYDQGLIVERVTASHDGLLLHSMYLPAKEDVVLVGRDEDDILSTLATGCGDAVPAGGGILMAFEVGGAPYLLVGDSSLGTKSVYPILPMP